MENVFHRPHRTFQRLRQKKVHCERASSPSRGRDGGERRDGCRRLPAPEATRSLHTEDTESIDLGRFENTKLCRVKKWHSMSVTGGRSRLGITGHISVENPKRVLRNSGRSDGCRSGKRRRDASFKETTSGGTSSIHVTPEVKPQNRDFDANEFLRSSPNPVVASFFGDPEIIQRAAVRRGYLVMKSRFLNFGDDVQEFQYDF